MADTLWSILVVYGVATMPLLRNFAILQVSLSLALAYAIQSPSFAKSL